VSRIPLDAFFQKLLAGGLTPDTASKRLAAGALDLYRIKQYRQPDEDGILRHDSKVVERVERMPRETIPGHLRFFYSPPHKHVAVLPVNPMEITPWGTLAGVLSKARFEVDADRAEALIAKLTALPPLSPPKRKRGKGKDRPGTRKAWALDRLRELIKAGDGKATKKVLDDYQTKFGKVRDPQKRANLRRNIDRWREKVEAEIAAEKNSDN
jgi:hypothetical protein